MAACPGSVVESGHVEGIESPALDNETSPVGSLRSHGLVTEEQERLTGVRKAFQQTVVGTGGGHAFTESGERVSIGSDAHTGRSNAANGREEGERAACDAENTAEQSQRQGRGRGAVAWTGGEEEEEMERTRARVAATFRMGGRGDAATEIALAPK